MRKVVAVQPHRPCSRETPGAERCLVTEFLKSGGHFLLSFVPPFTEEDLGFVLFPKPLHAWTLHPPVTPTHTAEERCWAYELLRAGTSCAWSSALLNFRTDTLSWKHFQCPHRHVDISISPYLNGFSYCMCYWASFPAVLLLPLHFPAVAFLARGWMGVQWAEGLADFLQGSSESVEAHIRKRPFGLFCVLLLHCQHSSYHKSGFPCL